MALPKRRHSNSRTAKRRTHDRLPTAHLARCPRCSSPKLPHRVCGNCGYYRGRPVVDMERT